MIINLFSLILDYIQNQIPKISENLDAIINIG